MVKNDVEEGSVTPVIAGMIVVLFVVGLAILGAAAAHTVKVRGQMAADLAALAAAVQVPSALVSEGLGTASACEYARIVAERNGASLKECWPDQGDIRVVVERKLVWQGLPFAVSAKARAGPVSWAAPDHGPPTAQD